MYRFLIVVEKANGNYCAYSPDLPGCVATGKTPEVTRKYAWGDRNACTRFEAMTQADTKGMLHAT